MPLLLLLLSCRLRLFAWILNPIRERNGSKPSTVNKTGLLSFFKSGSYIFQMYVSYRLGWSKKEVLGSFDSLLASLPLFSSFHSSSLRLPFKTSWMEGEPARHRAQQLKLRNVRSEDIMGEEENWNRYNFNLLYCRRCRRPFYKSIIFHVHSSQLNSLKFKLQSKSIKSVKGDK